jgi:hypothetical protein
VGRADQWHGSALFAAGCLDRLVGFFSLGGFGRIFGFGFGFDFELVFDIGLFYIHICIPLGYFDTICSLGFSDFLSNLILCVLVLTCFVLVGLYYIHKFAWRG